ncbi:MAG: hypothetical protein JSW51_00815 [Gemmatimonadota bacterium]|nr:MAG: hypothetical protein JSW51_00815 [Gemmatimonadota bacterium]
MSIPTQQDHQEAKETLDYIRRTMETASTFTAVSGWGLVVSGIVGLAAAWLSRSAENVTDLRIWIPAAAVSVIVATGANAMKARGTDVPLWSGVLRRVVWVMAPTLIAGAMLTFALDAQNATRLLPGMWLALYGAGVTAGGTLSVRAIRWMGVAFLVLGAIALLRVELGLVMLALGFGGLHIGVGLDIVWRHGG